MTTGKGGYASNVQNRGQQEKRPRHECAAKLLSAHLFWRHAPARFACRWVDKYFEGLNFLRAGYP
jgi:hypothetical protein